MLDGAIGLTDGVGTCGASRHDRHARALGVVADSDATCCHIANHGRNHQWGDPSWSFSFHLDDFTHDGIESADARTDINA